MSIGNASFSRTSVDFRLPAPSGAKQDAIHGDVDDEGNPPPSTGHFIDPALMSDIAVPPPRGNVEVRLPFFKPADRVRYRGQFESRITYEDWVANDASEGAGRFARSNRREVKKLEEDSDFPVGKPYFWKAFCVQCNVSYNPHVPTMWSCPRCKGRVWQQPSDPESKACAVCSRKVAPIVLIGERKIRNPMSLNAHVCKRCGKVVCDQCYSPVPQSLEEYGYSGQQRTCVKCVNDLKEIAKGAPPPSEDVGTLHDEHALGAVDELQFLKPFWPPQCRTCGTTYGQPPPRWECPSCKAATWQPTDAHESANCFICGEKFPKVRCYVCGQLACNACGAYGQPLPHMGYEGGTALSVCKCCYDGVSCSAMTDAATEQAKREVVDRAYQGSCPVCNQRFRDPPAEWMSKCHKRACWQAENAPGSGSCAVCTLPISEECREHCAMCGWLVCVTCAQYRQPVVERGYPKGQPQIVCRACYNPRKALLPDHNDFSFWPPRCPVCTKRWDKPPDRWRCSNQCGNVWQPITHVASMACCCCGKKTNKSGTNCRMCGRIACTSCLSKAEVIEMGFTRGMFYPRCKRCTGGGVGAQSSANGQSPNRTQSPKRVQTPSRSTSPARRGSMKSPPTRRK